MGEGGGGLNREGGLINFPPLKRGGLLERGGLIEDLRYVNGTLSDYIPVSCGVPQSSVLGPLLFLIYINGLQKCELSSSALMYADDTSLTLSAYDPATLEEKLNKDLDEVQKWLKSNKLTLNVKKTKYMIIGSHYRLRHLNGDLNVTVNSHN